MHPASVGSALARALSLPLGGGRPLTVTLTGSGGKTTCSEELALAAAAAGWKTVLTTSTRMRPTPQAHAITTLAHLDSLPWTAARPLVLGTLAADGRKLLAPPRGVLEALTDHPDVDLVVIEADGSRGASIKAYRDQEPVLPSHVDLNLVLLGVDALLATCRSPLVHRGAQLAALLGIDLDTPLQASHIRQAMEQQPAYLGMALGTPTAVVLNKIDDAATRRGARALQQALLPALQAAGVQGALWRGLVVDSKACWSWRSSEASIPVAVLAAGQGHRYGALKQLAPLGDTTLLEHTLQQLLDAPGGDLLLVLGAGAEHLQRALCDTLASPRLHLVVNPGHARGLSTSLRCAVHEASSRFPSAPGLLVALGDMPCVSARSVDAVLQAASTAPERIVAPSYQGERGHPVYLPRALFGELALLEGDRGASPLLAAHHERVLLVPVDHPGVLQDVDLPGDLDKLSPCIP